MTDAYHFIGGDLQLDATGDIQTADPVDESRQRILRRLMTNKNDYWWHGEYGAGLGQYVGQPIDLPVVTSLIKSQMFLEASVVQSPQPQITVTQNFNALTANIQYLESDSNLPVTLSFSAKV